MNENIFAELNKVNVNQHVEKKGRFSYLSWPFAVSELRKADPSATWETIKFDGKPYCDTPAGCFVEVAVTVKGVKLSQIHPVLDNNNKTVKTPDAFQINTSIQRCLVKAIALHGLGLYIYAGEDLPEDDENKVQPPRESAKSIPRAVWDELTVEEQNFLTTIAIDITAALLGNNMDEALRLFYENNLDSQEQTALWSRLDSKQRASIKSYKESLKKAA